MFDFVSLYSLDDLFWRLCGTDLRSSIVYMAKMVDDNRKCQTNAMLNRHQSNGKFHSLNWNLENFPFDEEEILLFSNTKLLTIFQTFSFVYFEACETQAANLQHLYAKLNEAKENVQRFVCQYYPFSLFRCCCLILW